MLLLGLAAPLVKGGFEVPEAQAQTVASNAPIIEPLDVAAVQAKLADADRAMDASRRRTDRAVARLQQLAR